MKKPLNISKKQYNYPETDDIYTMLSMASFKLGRFPEQIKYLEKAVEIKKKLK